MDLAKRAADAAAALAAGAGNSVWEDGAFAGQFADPFSEDTNLEGGHIRASLRCLLGVLRPGLLPGVRRESLFLLNDADLGSLDRVIGILGEAQIIGDAIAEANGSPAKLSSLISDFRDRLLSLPVGNQISVPGGWHTKKGGHAIMWTFDRTGADTYSFVSHNSGQGLGCVRKGRRGAYLPSLLPHYCVPVSISFAAMEVPG